VIRLEKTERSETGERESRGRVEDRRSQGGLHCSRAERVPELWILIVGLLLLYIKH
jgi:hypothetical protein